MPGQLRDRPVLAHVLLPLVAGLCALAIFILDTITELEIAAAVLYVAVVLMAVSFCQARGVLFITVGCMALTVLSHFLSPGLKLGVTAVANALLSLTAIGVTAFLALKNQSAVIALQRARAELAHVTRMTTLGELTASIAHEVNQPLTGVVSNANACLRWLAAQPPNLEEARLAVERVADDGIRASEFIRRVRALARRAPLQKSWLDINEPITDVAALIRNELQQNRVAIDLHLASDLPPVLGDRVQLQQVILNLIMNAVEAMSGADATTRELSIRSEKADLEGVVVTVRDSGSGLDPKTLDQLFDAFYTTKQGGMGMGLAISRTIVEAHGGRLWATPNVPHGAIFQFRLPVRKEAKPHEG
jgi:signal transduction histidine kinase